MQRILELHGAFAGSMRLDAVPPLRPEHDQSIARELDHVTSARCGDFYHLLEVHIHERHHLAKAVASLLRKVFVESREPRNILRPPTPPVNARMRACVAKS